MIGTLSHRSSAWPSSRARRAGGSGGGVPARPVATRSRYAAKRRVHVCQATPGFLDVRAGVAPGQVFPPDAGLSRSTTAKNAGRRLGRTCSSRIPPGGRVRGEGLLGHLGGLPPGQRKATSGRAGRRRRVLRVAHGVLLCRVSCRNSCCTSLRRACARLLPGQKRLGVLDGRCFQELQQERGRIRRHRLRAEQRCGRWRWWRWRGWQRGDRHTGRAKELHLGTVEQPDILRPARGGEARPEHERG